MDVNRIANVGDIEDDNEKVKGIVLFYLAERHRNNEGPVSLGDIKDRIAAMNSDYVEKDVHDLNTQDMTMENLFTPDERKRWIKIINDNDPTIHPDDKKVWVITEEGLKEVERRENEGRIY